MICKALPAQDQDADNADYCEPDHQIYALGYSVRQLLLGEEEEREQ
jgi:hypothetical protein